MPNTITLVAKLQDNLSGPLQNAGNKTQSFGSSLSGMATKAGIAAAAISGVVAAVGAFADSMASIRDSAAGLGVSTDTIQSLGYAFRQTGGDSETFTKSMRGMTSFMRTAAQGGSEQTAVLAELGMSYEELAAMAPEEQFLAVTDALGEMTNAQEQAEAGAALFGARYSQQIIGTLSQTGGTLREISQEFKESDMMIPEDAVMAAASFSDTMEDMKTQLTAVAAEALQPLMPILSELIAWFGELMNSLSPLLAAIFNILTPVMALADAILGALMPVIDALVAIITPLVDIFTQQLAVALTPTIAMFEFLADMLGAYLTPALEALMPIFDTMMGSVNSMQGVMDSLLEALEPLQEIFLELATTLGETLGLAFEVIGPLIAMAVELFAEMAEGVLPLVVAGIGTLAEILQAVLVPILDGLQWVIETTMNGMRALGLISEETAEETEVLVEGLEEVEVAADNAAVAVRNLTSVLDSLNENMADWSIEELVAFREELNKLEDDFVGAKESLLFQTDSLIGEKAAIDELAVSYSNLSDAQLLASWAEIEAALISTDLTEYQISLLEQELAVIEAIRAAREEEPRGTTTTTTEDEDEPEDDGGKEERVTSYKQALADLYESVSAWNDEQLSGEDQINAAYSDRMAELEKLQAMGADMESIEEAQYQAEVERENALATLRQEHAEQRISQAQKYASQAAELFNGLANLQSTIIDANRKRELDAVENSVANEDEKKARIETINRKYDEKEKAAAVLQKGIKIAQAISNVALGVTTALAKGDVIGAAIIGAMGAIEIATIVAQPYAKGGWVEGSGTGDTVPALLTPGEYVIPREQAKLFAAGGIVLPRGGTALGATGGGSTVIVNMASTISTASKAEMMRAADVIQRSLKERGITLG